jgi:DNA replication protein DnaC
MKQTPLEDYLNYLKLPFIRQNMEALTQQATQDQWSFSQYLRALIEGEAQLRQDNKVARRIRGARFPVLKSLEDFDWSWPKKINRAQAKELFELGFLQEHANVILLGGVGLGKTHLAIALGYAACLRGHSVLFTSAVDIINTLAGARAAHQLHRAIKKYLSPTLLVMDEVGYLPIDKVGADLLFQVISERYEKGSIILTTNLPFKDWAKIFNNDATLTSAVLDRLLHHAHSLTILGRSYRMKDQIPDPE